MGSPIVAHDAVVDPYAGPVKVREPVARPLDVVVAELLLSASQAFLVGVLLYLAVGVWDDRGVGFGPVAVIVAGLGIAVGGGWLYWLLGGVGWPLAAANVPTSLFLGFALVLAWSGDDFFRVEGVPLSLSLAAAVYGLVCGVFLDPPRRLRWDQRQRPRPGTPVPRVSATSQRLAAGFPRSIPRRATLQPADYVPLRQGPADGAPSADSVANAGADAARPAAEQGDGPGAATISASPLPRRRPPRPGRPRDRRPRRCRMRPIPRPDPTSARRCPPNASRRWPLTPRPRPRRRAGPSRKRRRQPSSCRPRSSRRHRSLRGPGRHRRSGRATRTTRRRAAAPRSGHDGRRYRRRS